MFWGFFNSKPKGDDVKDLFPGTPNVGFGKCECCQRSWKWVENHTTKIDDISGIFPLCETCWEKLTPEERLPYYWKLFHRWEESDADEYFATWQKIKRAVLEGK